MDQDERGHGAILSQTDCDDGAVTISRDELAHRVDVAVGDVDRLVEAGLITPEGGSQFIDGDVWRTRFLLGLEQGGVPLDAVAQAVRSGDLSFDFFDAPYWERFGGLSDSTFEDVSRDTGLSHECARRGPGSRMATRVHRRRTGCGWTSSPRSN